MAIIAAKNQPKSLDPIWDRIRQEAAEIVQNEPTLAAFIYSTILNHDQLEESVAYRVSDRLNHPDVGSGLIKQAFSEMYNSDRSYSEVLRVDIAAVYDRDPACFRYIEPLLYFKGFQAVQAQRLAHWLYENGRRDFAFYLQSRVSAVFQVDIHPAVPMGRGVFLDHGTGIVIGETAVIEDDVSILQNVTLGGTGKEDGDRHPKIRRGVLIGAGAKILGNLEIGKCSRVASGSVVLQAVPEKTTVAGVPARIVGQAGCSEPSRSMDQRFEPDSKEKK